MASANSPAECDFDAEWNRKVDDLIEFLDGFYPDEENQSSAHPRPAPTNETSQLEDEKNASTHMTFQRKEENSKRSVEVHKSRLESGKSVLGRIDENRVSDEPRRNGLLKHRDAAREELDHERQMAREWANQMRTAVTRWVEDDRKVSLQRREENNLAETAFREAIAKLESKIKTMEEESSHSLQRYLAGEEKLLEIIQKQQNRIEELESKLAEFESNKESTPLTLIETPKSVTSQKELSCFQPRVQFASDESQSDGVPKTRFQPTPHPSKLEQSVTTPENAHNGALLQPRVQFATDESQSDGVPKTRFQPTPHPSKLGQSVTTPDNAQNGALLQPRVQFASDESQSDGVPKTRFQPTPHPSKLEQSVTTPDNAQNGALLQPRVQFATDESQSDGVPKTCFQPTPHPSKLGQSVATPDNAQNGALLQPRVQFATDESQSDGVPKTRFQPTPHPSKLEQSVTTPENAQNGVLVQPRVQFATDESQSDGVPKTCFQPTPHPSKLGQSVATPENAQNGGLLQPRVQFATDESKSDGVPKTRFQPTPHPSKLDPSGVTSSVQFKSEAVVCENGIATPPAHSMVTNETEVDCVEEKGATRPSKFQSTPHPLKHALAPDVEDTPVRVVEEVVGPLSKLQVTPYPKSVPSATPAEHSITISPDPSFEQDHDQQTTESPGSPPQFDNARRSIDFLHSQDQIHVSSNRKRRVKLQSPRGHTIVKYGNGSVKEIRPDGVTVVTFHNGDIQTMHNGSVSYYYRHSRTISVSQRDGSKIWEFPNGQVEQHWPDGNRIVLDSLSYRTPDILALDEALRSEYSEQLHVE